MNKFTRKRFSFLVSIMLALSIMFTNLMATTVFAEEYSGVSTLTSSAVELDYEGEQKEYEVWFEPSDEFTSFYLKLELPEFVEITNVMTNYELGADNEGYVGSMTGIGAGGYTCEFNDNIVAVSLTRTSAVYGMVKLFTLNICALENIDYTGHVRALESQFINSNENILDVDIELGDITVNAKESLGKMGDMDGDNDVDLVDLVTVQRSLTALSGDYALNEVQQVLADINCDGKVDMVDCQLIRKYIVGLIDTLENFNKPVNKYCEVEVYYGYGDDFTLEGEYTVKEGVNLYSYLEDLAYQKGYNYLSFWYSYPYNAISSDDIVSNDTKAYILLEEEGPKTFMFSFYTNANGEYEYVGFVDCYEGEGYYAVTSRLGLENIYGVYFDRYENEYVDAGLTISDNVIVYIDVLGEPETPSEYSVTVNYENVSNGDKGCAGIYNVPANVSLVEYLTEVALSNDAKVESVYLDSSYATPIDYGYIISSDMEVWVVVSNIGGGDETPSNEYYMFIYASTRNGFQLVQQLSVYEGDSIPEIITMYYAHMLEIIDGVFYDAEMKEHVDASDVVTGDVNVYLYVEEMHGSPDENQIFMSLYRNRTLEGNFEYWIQFAVEEGMPIIQTILGYLGEDASYIEGFYYDADMLRPVGMRDVVSQSVDIYLYSSRVGEDVGGGENVDKQYIYVDLVTADGQIFNCFEIKIYQGESILNAVRNYLENWNISVYAWDEENSEISGELVYGEHYTNSYYVTIIPVYVNIMNENCEMLNRITSYGFEGDHPKEVAIDTAIKYGYYNYMDVAPDGNFDERFTEEDTVYDYMDVYVMVEGNKEEEGLRCYVNFMEEVNGVWLPTNSGRKRAEEGALLREIADEVVLEVVGNLYEVVGYYYDKGLTREVPADATLMKDGTDVYVKIALKDISGTYMVVLMSGEQGEDLILNADGTATFGEHQGEWLFMGGMLIVNYGEYSQNIYMLQIFEQPEGDASGDVSAEMGDMNGVVSPEMPNYKGMAMLGVEFYSEEFEVQDKFAQVAGDYVWFEEEMEEMGVGAYSITLKSNGVCFLTAMGMTLRVSYDVVYENVVEIYSDMMGGAQAFNINKETGEAVMNYLARYVGTFRVVKWIDGENAYVGSVTIGWDNNAELVYANGTKVNCVAVSNSGNLALFFSEFHYLHIGYEGDYDNITALIIYEEFNGSSYVEIPEYADYVGTYDIFRYEGEESSIITFYSNGAFKIVMYGNYFMMGRYEVTDGIVTLYTYDHEYEDGRYVFDAQLNAYVRYNDYVEENKPDKPEDVIYDIPTGNYEILGAENMFVYLQNDGKGIMHINGGEQKYDVEYKYDGKVVYIEGMRFIIDVDAMTLKPLEILDNDFTM